MFRAFCPRHEADVLLSPRSIDSIVNVDDGIELHWRCPCGGTGVIHTGVRRPTRGRRPAVV